MIRQLVVHAGCLALVLLQGASVIADDQPPFRNPKLPIEQRVADLVSRMTIEEKVGQLGFALGWQMYEKNGEQIGESEAFRELVRHGQVGGLWGLQRADPWTRVTLKTGLSPRQSAEAVNLLQRYVIEHTRLGIPMLLAEECPHGHMAIGATVFPTAIGQASTWNPSLIQRMATVIAAETRAGGATIGYGPVLDLAREPRWSRVEETYGEDPVLCREMGVGMVQGFQGAGLDSPRAILSTLKHFAGHGIPEGGHNSGVANIGPRELHSALLPAFRACVRAGAGSLMSSYNEIDGIPCSSDKALLTDLLRNRWNFDGFVVSDLEAIPGLHTGQHVAADLSSAAAMAITAGVDADLGAHAFAKPLLDAIRKGTVRIETLDQAVSRVLRAKFRLGLFENPYAQPADAEKIIRCAEHRAIALQVACESVILLKNSGNLLPLQKELASIAVIGPNADSVYNQLGDYTAPQPDGAVTTVLAGIRTAVSPRTVVRYTRGCAIRDSSTTGFAEAIEIALKSEVAVVVLGGSSARNFNTLFDSTGAAKPSLDASGADMDSGEGFDRASLDLAGVQLELLKAIVTTGKPVVLVLIKGRPLNLNWPAENVPAIVDAWYPGQEGGQAIASVLFGQYNPAGRLPISVPRSVGQLPIYYNFKPNSRRDYTDLPAKPLYPFGFGLSYSAFEWSHPQVTIDETANGIAVSIQVDVQNISHRDGDEVVQVYIHQHISSITVPDRSLKAFQRISLHAGEKRTVSFKLKGEDLAILNRDLQWVVEPGSYNVMFGASSDDIRQQVRFDVTRHLVIPE